MNIKKINSYTYYLAILFLTIYFNFFENVYVIYKSNFNERLVSNYGYCEKNSYGFIKFIEKKYKFNENISIQNDEIYPSSQAFIYKPKKENNKKFLILLNRDENKKTINIKNYSIIEKFKNCYYLKKND
ncbi:hypothetical protein N8805_04140 [Candidatus Pelagibacter ubique]|nr:hypothetical protein [Candidatus Pelagibacter ubique]